MRIRYLVLILLAILIFGLIGCSSAKQEVSASQKTIDQMKSIIEGDTLNPGNKLTKVASSQDGLTLYLAYKAGYANDQVDMSMGKEKIFLYVQDIAKAGYILNIDIRETDVNGSNLHCYTSAENMVKIKNLKMTYDDWVKVAF